MSQADRAVIRARVIAAPIPPGTPIVPRPDLPRHLQVTTGPIGRAPRAARIVQRDSTGRRSDWARPAHIGGRIKPVIIDARWGVTRHG